MDRETLVLLVVIGVVSLLITLALLLVFEAAAGTAGAHADPTLTASGSVSV